MAILGIGSELRGDDAVGLLVLEHLRKKINIFRRAAASRRAVFAKSRRPLASRVPTFKLFNGGTAPENLTGEIRRFQPGHLIMIDAVKLGKRPGTIALVDLKKVESTAFLTHKLSVKLMLDYLAAEMTFTTVFIGIQPRSLEFEGKISKPVSRAGRELADLLTAAFNVSAGDPCLSDGKRRTNSRRRK